MSLSLRVYYADTDCGGVVYYANYLKYLEAGRMEFMRERGIDLSEWHKNNVVFVVVETNIKYRASARLDDLLTIETNLTEKSSVTFVFTAEIRNQHGVLLVSSQTKLACLGENGKMRRVPEELIEAIAQN